MKRILIGLAVCMLVGMTSSVEAAFELGNFQLVAIEEEDNTIAVGTEGYEVHFDLGTSLDAIDGTTINTGITLDDYDATSWDDIYVGIFGGGYDASFSDVPAYFASSTTEFTPSANTYSMFQQAILENSSMTGALDTIRAKSDGEYWRYFQMSGDSPGSYGGLINAGSGFGGELQLTEGVMDDAMTMYQYDVTTFTDGSASFGVLSEIGSWTLDTTSGTLMATYTSGTSEVPIPGAVVLFGSGLLGLTGLRSRIRRKK